MRKIFSSKCLNLTFSDPKMEHEYTSTKQQQIMMDFRVTVGAVALITFTVVIEQLFKLDIIDITAPLGTVIVLLLVYRVRNVFAKYIEYLTLLVIFAYNAYRFVMLIYEKNILSKASFFMASYTLTVLQMILVSRISNMVLKIYLVIFSYIVRFCILGLVIAPGSMHNGTPARQIILDAFMIYYFYSNDKSQRNIFQNFYESREGLLKFKELLTDSLPQSVVVVDSTNCSILFSNKTFSSIFQSFDPESLKNRLSLLRVDQSTIREPGASFSAKVPLEYFEGSIQLDKVIVKLLGRNFLKEKSLSLTASYSNNSEHKSFDIILKRIKWDRTDAIAIILNDITYQEKIIALKVANTNKDQIIATVSHELRTPLHGIIGLLTMSEKTMKDPTAMEYVSLCKDNAHLLLGLVNSILDYQQITTGKLKLNITKINLVETLRHVMQLFQFQIREKGISLTLANNQDLPIEVETDENRLKQVLINLVANAVKFTKNGGVQINVTPDIETDEYLQIFVSDTGIGIRDEDKPKLFRMYGKLEDGESVNKNGVGLGLTISNALASNLSGDSKETGIQVNSQFGSGSTFFFTIAKYLKPKIQGEIPIMHTSSQKQIPLPLRDIKETFTRFSINVLEDPGDDSLLPDHISSKLSRYISLKKANLLDLNLTQKRASETKLLKRLDSEMSEDPQKGSALLKHHNHEKILPDFSLSHETPSKKSLAQGYILIVDDNPFNLLIAANLITSLGYSTKSAMGGQEAIDAVKNSLVDGQAIKAILMDCQMPIMDGYESTRILKEMMNKKEIPVIPILAWTANNSDEDIKRCFECGMVGHLSKPTSQDAIRKALDNIEEHY